jgi:hypothetical protein
MTPLAKNALVFVLLLSTFASSAQSIDPKLLIGHWQSTQDRKSELVFTKDKQIDYYENKVVFTSTYLVQHDSLIVVDMKYGDTLYYSIEGLSKKNLSLMYLARGNMLVFRRMNSTQ